ncbi:MAG: hypothetical protein Q8P67_13975, partial [archaeon]|nr:hypothetical protein [archaeon]
VGERQVHEVAEDRIDLDIGGEMEAQIAAEEEEEETGGGKGGERAQVKFTLSSAFMAAAVPKAIYRSAVAALPGDLQLRLGFVEGSRAFAGYAGFRSDVFAGIRADFAGSPEALDAWCRRSASEAGAEAVETGRRMALDSYDALLQEERYRQEPSSPLWDLYAAFLLEVCGQSPSGSDLHRLAISRLFSSFKHLFALSNQLLSQSSLLDSDQKQKQNPIQKKQKKQTVFSANRWRLWIDVLLAVGLLAEAQSTLQRAMEEHPADEALWLQAFRMAALRQPDTLQALLEELRALLLNCGGAETQWRLWRLYFARLVAHTAPGPNRLLKEMRRACCMLAADSLAALKPELLRILTSQGVDSAGMAGFYHFALQAKPNRLSFLQDCISWELCSASPEPLRVRRLFDVAVDECGSDHPSLWIDYIRFELSQDAPDRASALYWKARRTLLNPAVFVLHHSELTSPSL